MSKLSSDCYKNMIIAGHAPPASEEAGIRYPCAPTSLDKPVSEREARASLRAQDGYKRLPRDTEFW